MTLMLVLVLTLTLLAAAMLLGLSPHTNSWDAIGRNMVSHPKVMRKYAYELDACYQCSVSVRTASYLTTAEPRSCPKCGQKMHRSLDAVDNRLEHYRLCSWIMDDATVAIWDSTRPKR